MQCFGKIVSYSYWQVFSCSETLSSTKLSDWLSCKFTLTRGNKVKMGKVSIHIIVNLVFLDTSTSGISHEFSSVHPFVCSSIHLSVHPTACPFVCSSIRMFLAQDFRIALPLFLFFLHEVRESCSTKWADSQSMQYFLKYNKVEYFYLTRHP